MTPYGTKLNWSAEFVTLALVCFLVALLTTALGCYLFARLITAIAGQAAASTVRHVPEQTQPSEQVHSWMLPEPPASIREHTTHLLNESSACAESPITFAMR